MCKHSNQTTCNSLQAIYSSFLVTRRVPYWWKRGCFMTFFGGGMRLGGGDMGWGAPIWYPISLSGIPSHLSDIPSPLPGILSPIWYSIPLTSDQSGIPHSLIFLICIRFIWLDEFSNSKKKLNCVIFFPSEHLH